MYLRKWDCIRPSDLFCSFFYLCIRWIEEVNNMKLPVFIYRRKNK